VQTRGLVVIKTADELKNYNKSEELAMEEVGPRRDFPKCEVNTTALHFAGHQGRGSVGRQSCGGWRHYLWWVPRLISLIIMD
jgi:hypothetical protein